MYQSNFLSPKTDSMNFHLRYFLLLSTNPIPVLCFLKFTPTSNYADQFVTLAPVKRAALYMYNWDAAWI